MSKNLVIVESPSKVPKVKAFLGANFEVTTCVGHIRDLPEKKLGIDIKKGFEPTYEVYPDKKSVVKTIVTMAKKADVVYLLMDLDREGEGIAYHISCILPNGTKIKRATANSITKDKIVKAIKDAGDINTDLVNSYECRRLLDRLVGYKCSFVTKQATGGRSAGRVQSAALRILAEREKEIQSFVPQEYWPIQAELLTDRDEKVVARVTTPKELEITNQEQAETICKVVKDGPVVVGEFERKTIDVKPYPPFITSTMAQSASAILGWKPAQTMKVAQGLYEAGHITYMRTDSTYIVPEVIVDIRKLVKDEYGSKYVPDRLNVFGTAKTAQEAHEACRVTDLSTKTVSISPDGSKLYQLIWKRTVASQMALMKQSRAKARFDCKDIVLSANGSKVIFDGWRKVWNYGKAENNEFPELYVGEQVKVIDIQTEQKFTQPPHRYTEASFNKFLEDSGIGRPSTYASISNTLASRGYIVSKKNITVTDLGISVSDFLIASDFCFIDLGFTAKMEEKLDDIANDKAAKITTLKDFWERLKKDIDNAQNTKRDMSKTDFDCPKCGKKLLKRNSRFGPFYGCEDWKSGKKVKGCDYTAKIGEDGEPVEKVAKVMVESEDHVCKNCQEPLIVRQGKKGEYLGCRNWKSELCRGFYTLEGEPIVFKQKKYKKSKKHKG